MKKGMIFFALSVLIFSLLLGGCNSISSEKESGSDEVYEFRYGISMSEGHIEYDASVALMKSLEEKSGGRIECTLYPSNTFGGTDMERISNTINGQVTMCCVPNFAISGSGAGLEVFNITDYPYLIDSNELLEKFTYESGFFDEMAAEAEQRLGLRVYPIHHQGYMNIFSNKPIYTPDDMKGLKVRTSEGPLYAGIASAWGGNSVSIAFAEIYIAMEQKTVDAFITNTYNVPAFGFDEVIQYITVTEHQIMAHYPCINAEWFSSLPSDLQEVVDECLLEYTKGLGQVQEDEDRAAIISMENNGIVIIRPEGDDLAAWKNAAKKLYTEYPNAAGEGYLDEVRAWLGR